MSFTSEPRLQFLSREQTTDPRRGLLSMIAATESLRRANDRLEESCVGFKFNDATRAWLRPVVVAALLLLCFGCADLSTSGTCADCAGAGGDAVFGGAAAIGGTSNVAGGSPGSMRVLFVDTVGGPTDNVIDTTVELVNVSTTDVDLTTLALRYWFSDGTGAGIVVDGRTGPAGQQITNCLVKPARLDADHYIQIAFTTGVLLAQQSLRVTFAAHHSDWSNFDESDDYSWPGTTEPGDELTTIGVYQAGTLVGGNEP